MGSYPMPPKYMPGWSLLLHLLALRHGPVQQQNGVPPALPPPPGQVQYLLGGTRCLGRPACPSPHLHTQTHTRLPFLLPTLFPVPAAASSWLAAWPASRAPGTLAACSPPRPPLSPLSPPTCLTPTSLAASTCPSGPCRCAARTGRAMEACMRRAWGAPPPGAAASAPAPAPLPPPAPAARMWCAPPSTILSAATAEPSPTPAWPPAAAMMLPSAPQVPAPLLPPTHPPAPAARIYCAQPSTILSAAMASPSPTPAWPPAAATTARAPQVPARLPDPPSCPANSALEAL